jgi:cobalt-precorrin 5A hydrolase
LTKSKVFFFDPFETYSAAELLTVSEKYPQSAFVKKVTGVGSVCLAAADLASNGKVVLFNNFNRFK